MWPLNCFRCCSTPIEEETCEERGFSNPSSSTSLKAIPNEAKVINPLNSAINIPDDVKGIVFEILPLKDLINCTIVSKHWGTIVAKTPFYEYVKKLEELFFVFIGSKDGYDRQNERVFAMDLDYVKGPGYSLKDIAHQYNFDRLTKDLLSKSNLRDLDDLFQKRINPFWGSNLKAFIAEEQIVLLDYMINKMVHSPNFEEENGNKVCQAIINFIGAPSAGNKANALFKQFITIYPILNENLTFQKLIASCDTDLYTHDLPVTFKADSKISRHCKVMKDIKNQFQLLELKVKNILDFKEENIPKDVPFGLRFADTPEKLQKYDEYWAPMHSLKEKIVLIERSIYNFALSPFDEEKDAAQIDEIQKLLSEVELNNS